MLLRSVKTCTPSWPKRTNPLCWLISSQLDFKERQIWNYRVRENGKFDKTAFNFGYFSYEQIPWFQTYAVTGSVAIFLIYFCVLREENGKLKRGDNQLGKSEYPTIVRMFPTNWLEVSDKTLERWLPSVWNDYTFCMKSSILLIQHIH